MPHIVSPSAQARSQQTARGLRSLAIIGLACVLFVAVVYQVVTGI